MYHLLRERGRSVEAIGCAVAPRTVYEATFEGHRAARKLGEPQRSRLGARGVAVGERRHDASPRPDRES